MTSSTLQQAYNETEQDYDLKSSLNQQINSGNNNIVRQGAGLTTEVAAGLALDAKYAYLLGGGPLGWLSYAAIQAGGGGAANIAAQRIRGEEEINWGEVISAGLLGIIPFTSLRFSKKASKIIQPVIGRPGTFQRAVTGGAGMGAADRFIQSGINEGELPSAGDVAVGTLTGGIVGGGLQQAGKAVISNRLKNQIIKAQKEGRVEDLQKLVFNLYKTQNNRPELDRFVSYEDYITKRANLQGNLNDQINRTPSDYIRRNDLGEVVQNPLIAEKTRAGAAQVGEKYTTERSEAGTFRRLGLGARRLLLGEVRQFSDSDPNILTGRGSRLQDHHGKPLKTMTAAVDYLTDEGEELSMKWFHDRMGGDFGDLQVPYPLWDTFHYKLHDFLHLEMGPNAGMVRLLEQKHFGTRRLSDGISLQDRITPQPGQTTSFYEDIAHYLEESERIINTFHEALKGQARFSESTPEEYINRVISIAKLNEEFREITRRLRARSRSRNPSGGRAPRADVKEIINEIVGTADDELRSAIVFRNTYKRGTPKREAADAIIWNKFQRFATETLEIPGLSMESKTNRIQEFLEDYQLLDSAFPDEKVEDLIDMMVFQIDRAGIDTLPDIGAMNKREILNWMGRDI